MFFSRSLLCLCFLSAAGSAIEAQTFTANTVHFSDMGTFSQAQLEAASGMRAGTSFTTEQLGAAAQKLVDTGYFSEVGATVAGMRGAVAVKFSDKTIPATGMLRVGFENFVWLSRDEIDMAIRAKFPLFNGYLPENSPHQEDLKAALVAALAAKGIAAEVSYDEFEPTLRHPVREIAFTVSKPKLRVANVKLGGVTPALVPLIQKSVNSTSRTPYLEGPADLTTADSILLPLLDAGYVQAALTGASAVAAPGADGSVGVVLSATLSPGQIYKVSALEFAGTPVVPAAAFAASAKLHVGDVASRKLLLETLLPIDQAYRNKGYLDVVVDAHPTLDAGTNTVAYNVMVEPGLPYRVHQVTSQNLEGAAKADFDRGFRMKAGDVYDPSYLSGFLQNNTALRALNGYSASYKAYADPATHLVDVVVAFFKM